MWGYPILLFLFKLKTNPLIFVTSTAALVPLEPTGHWWQSWRRRLRRHGHMSEPHHGLPEAGGVSGRPG